MGLRQNQRHPNPLAVLNFYFYRLDCPANVGLVLFAQLGVIVKGQDVVALPGNYIYLPVEIDI